MNQTPKVSIVIPSYNDEIFIGDALGSVFSQTYKEWEAIVVDDGSTDNTVKIAKGFGDRVKVIEQSNSGSAVARNRGISEARAPLIAFLDADDIWTPDKLEIQMKFLEINKGANFVFCSWSEWNWPAAPNPLKLYKNNQPDSSEAIKTDPTKSGWLYSDLLEDCFIQTSSTIIKKELLIEVGMFDSRLRRGQDYDLWLRCSRITKIFKLKRIACFYRIHSSSITSRCHPVNYGAIILEKAIAKWGIHDPRCKKIKRLKVHKHICTEWRTFSIGQMKANRPMKAFKAILSALRWWPLDALTWKLITKLIITLTILNLIRRKSTN
jgi:glycosyltransferase involved in cell wall biosynthesis